MIAPSRTSPTEPTPPPTKPFSRSRLFSPALVRSSRRGSSASSPSAAIAPAIGSRGAAPSDQLVTISGLPSSPAAAHCTPNWATAVSDSSTTIASTCTCWRRVSSRAMTSASMRWVSGEAWMTRALAPGKRVTEARWLGTGAAGWAAAAPSVVPGAVAVAAVPGWPTRR